MPLPGTHTARQMPPGKCDKIRTQEITTGVSFNYCVRAGKADVQSVHFDAKHFTVEEAKAWLKKHDFSAADFVPAADTKAAATPDLACAMVDPADCPMGDKCPMRTGGVVEDASAEAAPVEIRASATGTCEIEAQAADSAALPRVNMLAYTGVPMKLDGFHLPVVVDLETLKVPRQKVPILRGHDGERIAGHSDKIDVTPQRLKASGVLSGTPKHTLDVVHTSKNGFPWQVSIGAQTTGRVQHVPAGESVKVNGRKWDGPLLVARNAVLRELSILPMGADGNTDAGFSAGGGADLLAQAVADLVAYDPADAAEVATLTETFPELLAYSEDQPRDDAGKWSGDGGGGGGGGEKGGGKGGGSFDPPDSPPPALNSKALSKAATAQLQKSADADKAGDHRAAKNHRAAAYMYNRAAMHLDNFRESKDPEDKRKAAAVRKLGHEFATGQRSLSEKTLSSGWADVDALTAAFCPTGPGGGVDPSCGGGDGGGGDQ